MREQIERLGGPGNWTAIADALPGRSSKSCRLRWCNQLNPSVKRGPFTPEEDNTILMQHAIHGNKWAVISRFMPGRTDNQVKNRFNSTLRRLISNQKKETGGASSSASGSAPASPRGKAASRPQSRLGDARLDGSNAPATPSRSKRERSLSPGETVDQAGGSPPKRPRSAPPERSSKLGDKRSGDRSSGDSRVENMRRNGETSAVERQGLDNLIQASLMELERLKSVKGEIHEWGTLPYGAARDCGTPELTRSEADNTAGSTLQKPQPKRGGFSVAAQSDMYDWRSHSPALSAPFLAGLKRVDSLASLNGEESRVVPSRPQSALGAPASVQAMQNMLQSDGWYSRMLDNLGNRKANDQADVTSKSIAVVKTESFVKPFQHDMNTGVKAA